MHVNCTYLVVYRRDAFQYRSSFIISQNLLIFTSALYHPALLSYSKISQSCISILYTLRDALFFVYLVSAIYTVHCGNKKKKKTSNGSLVLTAQHPVPPRNTACSHSSSTVNLDFKCTSNLNDISIKYVSSKQQLMSLFYKTLGKFLESVSWSRV